MGKISLTESHLGTSIRITVLCPDEHKARSAIKEAFKEAARIEAAYSRFIDGNDLTKLNERCNEWVEVEKELMHLIEFARDMQIRSCGAFDITVKSILEGWGYDPDYSLKESQSGKIGKVEINANKVRIGAEIDLGGLGKGYAIDQMVKKLSDFPNIMVNAGGDLFARGNDEKGPWRVALEHPKNITLGIGIVEVDNFAVGASSPLRRRWRNRHHLVDPKTGLPACKMQAVYTQAASAILADSYSTALFALGFEDAIKLLPNLPVEALLIGSQGEVWQSPDFKAELFLKSP